MVAAHVALATSVFSGSFPNASVSANLGGMFEHFGNTTDYCNPDSHTHVAEEWRETVEKAGQMVVIFGCGSLMFAFVIGNLLHTYKIGWIPESIVVIAVGAALGVLLQWITPYEITIGEESFVNKIVLNLICLPIIIFESGWALRKRDFVSQLFYILIFAVLGTLISMWVVASLILATSEYHGITSPRTAYTYAVLISAVDPVATLSTYAHLNVEPFLNIMVFGESVINDAVAIAVFRVLNDEKLDLKDNGVLGTSWVVGKDMIILLVGSIAFGLVAGVIYVLILRFAQMHHSPALEIAFVYLSTFLTYACAENVGMSGIIAVLFCGMFFNAYCTPHLTVEGRVLCSFLLKQMASLADMTVFLFVGVAVMFVNKHGFFLGCWICGFCLLGRFASTVPLSFFTNCIKDQVAKTVESEKRNKITPRHMFMMWHAGLRGGIALILTLDLGPWVAEVENDAERGRDSRMNLRNATLVVIVVFLLVFGGSTELCLRLSGIRMGAEVPRTEKLFAPREKKGQFWRFMKGVNRRLCLPVLHGSNPGDAVHMHEGVVAQVLRHEEQMRESGAPVARHASTAEDNANLFDLVGTHHESEFWDAQTEDSDDLEETPGNESEESSDDNRH